MQLAHCFESGQCCAISYVTTQQIPYSANSIHELNSPLDKARSSPCNIITKQQLSPPQQAR